MNARRPVRIANCSGFFGDRIAAARELVDGGQIDVLTGDWLAELTMLILARQRMKHGAGSGYARTFLTQMEQVLGTCLDRGIKVVSNAGGLDPQGCADALARQGRRGSGSRPGSRVVTGDDITARLPELLGRAVHQPRHRRGPASGRHHAADRQRLPRRARDRGGAGRRRRRRDHRTGHRRRGGGRPGGLVARLGLRRRPGRAWPGRSSPGHVIECGTQATGGNYSFFAEVPGLEHPGFPIAEVAADGSSVITKHDGTGGLVSAGTVTAQLLYEIGSPAYANPDVTALFDTIALEQVGPDRVQIAGVRGEPAPQRLKVSMNYLGGFRNSMSLVLTGLDIEAKADLALRTVTGLSLAEAVGDPRRSWPPPARCDVAELDVDLRRAATPPTPPTAGQAQAHLHLTVKDADPRKVGKPFTAPVVESALGSYPGMFPTAPPAEGTPFGVYWPTTIAADLIQQTRDAWTARRSRCCPAAAPNWPHEPGRRSPTSRPSQLDGPTQRVPLGHASSAPAAATRAATRTSASGPATARAYGWLVGYLTPGRIEALLPEAEGLPIDVFALPNLNAVNIVIHGLLGRGVSDSTRLDPQAKGLGEQLRARLVDVPEALLR